MINLREEKWDMVCMPISKAKSLEPFEYGAEYSAPVRGPWNIVHVGMLMPQSHQVFVCGQACLRGVILTAAELFKEGLDRFSTVTIQENNVLDGDMEKLFIEGVSDILDKMDEKPKAILLFSCCLHQFMGTDLNLIFRKLCEKYPEVDFAECCMNPIMRKKVTPDVTMRKQLFSLLPKFDKKHNSINVIGNLVPILRESEIVQHLYKNGYELKDICDCKSYDEYQKMGESSFCLTYLPAAVQAGEELELRLNQKHMYLPMSYNFNVLDDNIKKICKVLKIEEFSTEDLKNKVKKKCIEVKNIVGDTPIMIDYTSTPRPLELARFLLENDFNVVRIYADVFNSEEEDTFKWLQTNVGEVEICATIHPAMVKEAHRAVLDPDDSVLAIGQKAAFFNGTSHFVNIQEGNGFIGYEGIIKLLELIEEAKLTQKDVREIVTVKGWGCCA